MTWNPSAKHRPESGAQRWIRASTLRLLDECVGDDALLDGLLDKHGLDRSILHRPDAVIAADQVASLVADLAQRSGRANLGMRLARLQRENNIVDTVELGIFNAPTLELSFLFGAAHSGYFSPAVHFWVDVPEGATSVCLHYLFDSTGVDVRQMTEYGCLLASMNIMDLARTRPQEVWFRHGRISPQADYDRAFGAPVRFEMPYDGIFVTSEDFKKPIIGGDPELYQVGTEISSKRQAPVKPLSAHLYGHIERLLPIKKCSYDNVCRHIGLSPRTLRRYLAAENMTFKKLKDVVRRDRITEALARPGTRRTDLANDAGYYDPASVTRNLKRWVSEGEDGDSGGMRSAC